MSALRAGDIRVVSPATVFWLTGLSGAGKTTIALALKKRLDKLNAPSMVLDGDELRAGINADLGFSDEHRRENARRIAHVAKLVSAHATIVIVAAITPRTADRALARSIVGTSYVEVYVGTSLSACEQRDPKGLYHEARAGHIKTFTGVSAAYEVPESPEILIDTEAMTVDAEVDRLIDYLLELQPARAVRRLSQS